MGSNGTVDERLAEAEAARQVLGARWRVNLRLPDRALGSDPSSARAIAALVRRGAAARRGGAVLGGSASGSRGREPGADRRRLQRRAAPLRRRRRGVEAGLGLLLLHQRLGAAVVRRRRQRRVRDEAPGAGLSRHASSGPPAATAVPTRLTSSRFAQLIESRDAQFGALAGVAFAEGIVVREPVVRPHLFRAWDAS